MESLKKNNISINVFVINEKNKILPVHITNKKQKLHANLLLLEEDGKFHYCLINDLSRLVKSQLTKHRKKIFICERCLNYFHIKSNLKRHKKLCQKMNKCAITLPSQKEKFLEFKNFKNQLFNPFVIYYDSECILKKCNNEKIYQEHEIFSIGLYIVNRWHEKESYYRQFYGENVVLEFMQELEKIANDIEKVKIFSFIYIL